MQDVVSCDHPHDGQSVWSDHVLDRGTRGSKESGCHRDGILRREPSRMVFYDQIASTFLISARFSTLLRT